MNCTRCLKMQSCDNGRLVKRERYSGKVVSQNTSRPLVVSGHTMKLQGSILYSHSLSQSSGRLDSLSSPRTMAIKGSSHSISLFKLWWLCLVLLVVVDCRAEDSTGLTSTETVDADKYLSSFGYYPRHLQARDQTSGAASPRSGAEGTVVRHTDNERHRAIERLQEFFHLPVNGQLDKQTKTILKTARCGRKDIEVSSLEDDARDTDGPQTGSKRVKRYSLNKYGDGSYGNWKDVSELTWKITRPSRQLSEAQQKEIFRTSLNMWAKYMPIKFVEDRSQNTPDIDIHFARGEHGPKGDPIFDGSPTGSLNVLAHAWGPGYNPKGLAGDVHFDEDDDWKNYSTLLGVAVHELGHSMGLGHSDDSDSIMYPIYRDVVELGRDDINGITEMYRSHKGGKPVNPDANRPKTQTPIIWTHRPDTRYQTERPDPRYQTDRPDPRYQTDRPDPRYMTVRPDPRYQTDRPDPRYITVRPDPRYQTDRPDPRYMTVRPDPRYQTDRPDPRYQTDRPDPRYRTDRPDPRYQTDRPDPRYRTDRPDPRYQTVRPDPRYQTDRPDPRYRTDRPDPRYRTQTPDIEIYPSARPDPRYQTRQPDPRIVPFDPRATEPPVDLCTTINVDAVFEDPTTKVGRSYIAVSDEYLHTLTQHGVLIKSQQLKDVYPEAPINPDVAFSISKKQTVYFIKDNTMWAYNGNKLQDGYPRSLRNLRFPEVPRFSVTIDQEDGNSRLLLFGAQYWWTFDVDRPTAITYQPISTFSAKLPRGVRFATRWIDNNLYAVTQDSYVVMDMSTRRIIHEEPIAGKPEWLQSLCGDAARASLSVTSLAVLVILANILKSVLL